MATLNPDYLQTAVSLARQAGEIARANFTLGMAREWKEDSTPVTATDLAINHLVIEEIARHYPDHGVLGEEVSSVTPDHEWVWVCDPIDGTVPFSHGIPVTAFSLGLTYQGESKLGVVYDFLGERFLTAAQGGGAFLNGEPMRVSPQATLARGVMDLEALWSRSLPSPFDLTRLPGVMESENVRILKLGSTVYAGMLVGIGELIGLISRGDKPWDLAALDIIVREAGGRVTDLRGNPLRCDRPILGAVVSNGLIHDRLLELIASL